MTEIKNEEWRVSSLEISFQTWGDYKGKYVGKIKFENKESEAFMFNLRPDMAEDYLRLIKNDLVGAASHLGERVLNSLNLLPPPPEKKEIGTIIEEVA